MNFMMSWQYFINFFTCLSFKTFKGYAAP